MTPEEIQRRRHYTKNDTAAEAAIRKAIEEMEKSGIGGPNSTRALNLLHMARELHADDVDAVLGKGAPLAIMQEGPNFEEGLANLYGAALAEAGAPMNGTDPEDLMEWARKVNGRADYAHRLICDWWKPRTTSQEVHRQYALSALANDQGEARAAQNTNNEKSN
jgi:hypothetical protein